MMKLSRENIFVRRAGMHLRRRAAGGFTLVELVVAFALAGALVGGLLWFEYHTSETQSMLNERLKETAKDRRIMNSMTSHIQKAILYPQAGIAFQGDAERITFISMSMPDGDAWRPVELTADPVTPQQDLRILTWQLQYDEDDDGQEYIKGLVFYEEKILVPYIDEEEEVLDEDEESRSSDSSDEEQDTGSKAWNMSPSVQFVHFEFWDGGTWQPEWTDPTLPVAVRVRVGKKPLPEGSEHLDYPFETQERIVYIPGSIRAAKDVSTISGLGGR